VSANGAVVAGGGLAAQRCVERLRRSGYDAPIRMVCAEPVPPYDRPPLSKDFLAGTMTDPPRLRPTEWYVDNEVELLLGRRAARLLPHERELELDDGERLRYDRLLIATGASAGALNGSERYENAHVLRSLADAEQLRRRLLPGVRLAIIGAGFIGQEVAAAAHALGAAVTVIEALPAPLAQVLGTEVGRWFGELHRDHGVDVRVGAPVEHIVGNGRLERIELANGATVDCDAAVIGIGVTPATEWLAGSGLDPAGVQVDHAGRTGIPGVFAAGDCTGLGHWEAAVEQGRAAALAMLGEEPPAPAAASFWSDLYGTRVNWIGNAAGATSIEVAGDMDAPDFSVLYRRHGELVAALLVGRPQVLPEMRRQLSNNRQGASP
jgi:3-phenylpropionate/trans-cinnamate dioxygenase ferredoxin reductase subunit